MAQSSPENLLNFEPWMFKSSSFLGDSWMISEAFARDADDVLTKAFQKSFYSNNNDNSNYNNNEIDDRNFLIDSPLLNFVSNPAVSSLSGGSDDSAAASADKNAVAVVQNQKRNHHQNVPMINSNSSLRGVGGGGKITKRKSRASDRHKTTFINADPENFRQLVQQVTGVKFTTGGLNNNVPSAIGGILTPEAQRLNIVGGSRSCLPTLASSSFLLDRYQNNYLQTASVNSSPVGGGEGHVSLTSPPLTVGDGGGGLGGYDSFSSFPTLESWKVM